MTMNLTYDNDQRKQEPEQFCASKSPNHINGSACMREGDCQWCAVKDTMHSTQAAKLKQAPSDSFISAQPSWNRSDDFQEETQDPATEVSVDSKLKPESLVSNLGESVHLAYGLKRTDTTSQPQPAQAPTSNRRSAAIIPFRTIQKSFTFDIFRSIAKDTSRQIRLSIRRIGSNLDEKLTKDSQRSPKRPQQRPKQLGDRLRVAVKHSPLCNQYFLPDSTLRELVTAKSIDEELAQLKYLRRRVSQGWRRSSIIRIEAKENRRGIFKLRSRSTSELLRQEAEQTYRRVFAILTFIDRPTCIWDFVDEGVCDRVLPLLRITHGSVRLRGVESANPLRCFRNWSSPAIHEFLESRWTFLAPSFIVESKIAEHHEFKSEDILPITSWTISSVKGASGQVYKATIHVSHHSFDKDVVAVKHLNSNGADPIQNRENFINESGILRSLGQSNHMSQHLIALLATFERSGKYYLLFPWADGDLEDFWKEVSPQPDMSAWLIEQCRGLAEAMSIIHRYETTSGTMMPHQLSKSQRLARKKTNEHGTLNLIGRHGDIKPTNILWFHQKSGDGYGILKITDFGIARFTSENMASKRAQGFVPNSATYRSPECDLPSKQIGAHCDIWALGCVFLVFATWFFGGYDEVEKFTKRRQSPDMFWAGANSDNFFTIEGNAQQKPRAEVKPAVKKKINKLRIHRGCTAPFQKLLDLIEQDMLIIQKELKSMGTSSVTSSLEIPRAPRPRRMSAGNIARELG